MFSLVTCWSQGDATSHTGKTQSNYWNKQAENGFLTCCSLCNLSAGLQQMMIIDHGAFNESHLRKSRQTKGEVSI